MPDLNVRSASTANQVEGFSDRFNELLDRAQFPRENRFVHGSKRFEVVFNTFKSWCTANRMPGSHAQLTEIVESLLQDIGGTYNPKAVVAWLIAGEAVPHPFNHASDALAVVELYLQVSRVAKSQGVDFERLPRHVRNLIISQAKAVLPASHENEAEGVRLTGASHAVVVGMLETVRVLR